MFEAIFKFIGAIFNGVLWLFSLPTVTVFIIIAVILLIGFLFWLFS